jgi:hypothetical protein
MNLNYLYELIKLNSELTKYYFIVFFISRLDRESRNFENLAEIREPRSRDREISKFLGFLDFSISISRLLDLDSKIHFSESSNQHRTDHQVCYSNRPVELSF